MQDPPLPLVPVVRLCSKCNSLPILPAPFGSRSVSRVTVSSYFQPYILVAIQRALYTQTQHF